jgi:hypothetical protein
MTDPVHDGRAMLVSDEPHRAERIAGDCRELVPVELARHGGGVEDRDVCRVTFIARKVSTEHAQTPGDLLRGPRRQRSGREGRA